MTTGMIIIAVAAVIIAFAACANAAGTNATNVATSAEKSSKIGKQIGKEYYDSIPTGGTELEEFMAIGGTFIMPAVYRPFCPSALIMRETPPRLFRARLHADAKFANVQRTGIWYNVRIA